MSSPPRAFLPIAPGGPSRGGVLSGAESSPGAAGRPLRVTAGTGALPDQLFQGAMVGCALSILAIVLLIAVELVVPSRLTLHKFGWRFFSSQSWDPVAGDFGALPFIYGTIVSSLVALTLAVPLGVGAAIFMVEMCPRFLRNILAYFVELLAAIPSVIYGLWGILILAPILREKVEPFLSKYFSWSGLFSGPPYGIGMLAAGIILAIMIIPFISTITREVMLVVPRPQREGVLALGATRWETIRLGVLRNARAGVVGGIILALGRALGETMAVTMLIGNRPEISKSLLAPGYTMASVIANEFAEASDNMYLSALIEIGLALFLVTIIVNGLAQLLIWSITRGHSARTRG